MNSKEVVLEAFKLGVPERLPVTPWFGGGMWIVYNTNDSWEKWPESAEKMANTYISINEKVQSDIIFCGSGMNNFPVAALGGNLKYMGVSAPPDIAPPFMVKNEEDINQLYAKLESGALDEDRIVTAIRDATRLVVDRVGDEVLVCMTAFGPFTYSGQFMGIENLMMNLAENPELVHKLLEFSTKFHMEYYRPLIEDGVLKEQMVVITDPMAAPGLISKLNYQKFALPYQKKLVDHYHSEGSVIWLHMCNNWEPDNRYELLPETGAEFFLVDPKFNLGLAKREIGDKICLGGNVDQINVLNAGTPEDVAKNARKCIEQAAKGGGYVLSAGCDVPPTVPFENIQTLIKIGKSTKYKDDGEVILNE